MISSIKKNEGKNKKTDPLRLKQNNWTLDCTNLTKSKIQVYNCLKDKYLKFILPCPCKKSQSVYLFQHENKSEIDNTSFKQFLQNKKQMILKQKHILEQLKNQKENVVNKITEKNRWASKHNKFRKKVYKKTKKAQPSKDIDNLEIK